LAFGLASVVTTHKGFDMGTIVNKLNNRYLIAVVVGLFLLGVVKSFAKR
jgi:hypothetical protein